MKKFTVGIPAYKAQEHICDCLSSIQIQTLRDEIEVIIASDNPEDNYGFVRTRFPNLDIKILPCEKNTGPGLARQRCLDTCNTEWITFIDADDVFFSPFVFQSFEDYMIENAVEIQGVFLQEVKDNRFSTPKDLHAIPMNNIGHPWVFGRCYNVKFLRENDIGFDDLRAMEDGEFNWKIRMTIEGSPLVISAFEEPVYLWRVGSEHSITRIGEDKNGIPQYNYDLCPYGATEASIRAVKFCRSKNPFNGNILQFIAEQMVGQYFTYIGCYAKRPEFAEQNFFNAKKLYHECYEMIEPQIDEQTLSNLYTMLYAQSANELMDVIPCITFSDFMKRVKEDEYRGEDEFKEIRSRLPKDITDNDLKTGVFGGEVC